MTTNIPNIINQDGQAHYFGIIVNAEQKHFYFNELLNKIEWTNEKLVMFGKEIITKRKVAFYGDSLMSYTYSNKTQQALAWTPLLLEIKNLTTSYTGSHYNACLLNLYHDGEEGMGWHSDDEKEIITNSSIASLSFGAERKFAFKHREIKETISLILEHGSLLVMKGTTQTNWLHRLPPTKRITKPRINLTFRTIDL
jgi:alkylated DNA repair dioxygenase AlkB